ncbi:MAG TPA: DNA recombination protein RmuC [bacterium]|nr:DNA recombination protein RmuC [bacterium]HQG45896.1 DNA recombination protein RmuC [bacterium]HQI49548.1 DNA recombination protein RmuC [bacterium]HQJ65578.1 DNA recombination protein RmuC [bacterium]
MTPLAWSTLAIGLILGFLLAVLIKGWRLRSARELAEEIHRAYEAQNAARMQVIYDQMKSAFGSLSLEALSRSTNEFIKLAQTRLTSEREYTRQSLEEKQQLIDRQLLAMNNELEQIGALMQSLENDRAEKFGELAQQLQASSAQTTALLQATATLREALVNSKTRGQWGERMAEDVLRMAGFIENINYSKQKTVNSGRSRPDFTFHLPRNLVLHMDVKFPLDNYVRYLDATTEVEKARHKADFLKDVKQRIKEITTRDYISSEDNTVDYVLLFIPNEQIYGFIQEQDHTLFDDGLKQHVIACSPMTLFAVLAVVRQSIDNFALERTSLEILRLLGNFRKQWDEFIKRMEGLGKSLNAAQADYEALVTTRRRMLEVPLQKIEALRGGTDIEALPDKEGFAALD